MDNVHRMNRDTSEEGPREVALDMLGHVAGRGGAALRRFREDVLEDLDRRLEKISSGISGEGFDPFGMDPEALRRTAVSASFLYKIYFRCKTRGLDNLPDGPMIIVANHAGQLPIDAVMITTALMLEADPPRLARSMMDRWVPTLPFVATFYARNGVVLGSPENAMKLLNRGEALLVFPEGMAGITKTVDNAYRLQDFGLGFMRLSLATGAPIVPVGVIGSEEQYPTLYNLKDLGKALNLPSMPIWLQMAIPILGLLPLPVKYRLTFGEAMTFSGDPDDSDAVVGEKVDAVKERIGEMLNESRAARRSVFW